MALLVFFMMGIALWHFTVFLPDRFWQGIVGAFIGAVLGSIVFGMIVQEASGKALGDTDLSTALIAIPGTAIGLAIVYFDRRPLRRARRLSPTAFSRTFGLSGGRASAATVPSLEACPEPSVHLPLSPTRTPMRAPWPTSWG